MRTDLRRRLKDNSDAPAETRGDLPKNLLAQTRKTKLHSSAPTDDWSLPAASTVKPEKREFVVKDLNSAELDTVKVLKNPTTIVSANGEVLTKEEAPMYVRELDLFVTVMLLEDTPAVLSLGKLCEDHGYNYQWTSGPEPHLIKHGRKIDCNTASCVPFVGPGLSTSSSSSSSPASPSSSSQETVTPTEHPALTRSESMSEEVQGNLSHGPAETENPNTNDDNEEVQGDSSRGTAETENPNKNDNEGVRGVQGESGR